MNIIACMFNSKMNIWLGDTNVYLIFFYTKYLLQPYKGWTGPLLFKIRNVIFLWHLDAAQNASDITLQNFWKSWKSNKYRAPEKKWIYGKHGITFLSEGSTLSKTHFLFKLNFLTGHSMDRTVLGRCCESLIIFDFVLKGL